MTEMKCPACGAPLKFSASAGKVECEYCGTQFEIAQLVKPEPQEAPSAEEKKSTAEKQAAQQTARKEASKKDQKKKDGSMSGFEYDWGDLKNKIKLEPLDGARVYICKSCGAELVTTDTTASLKCPYCDNEIVLDDRVSGSIRPNGIIPFKISAKQLPDILKKFYSKAPLLPKKFFDDHRISETQGVYVPYWMFSGMVDADLHMEGAQIRHYSSGDYNCTETSLYSVERGGSLGFSGVPVDAHSRTDNTVTESLEPYDVREMTEFQNPYLAGFVTDRFDVNPDVSIPRAQERMYASTEGVFKATAPGYDRLSIKGAHFDMKNTKVSYVLLPAYFIRCEYGGKTYRIAVNGQTGKVVGELPIDKGRQKRAFFVPFGILTAVLFALMCSVL